MSVMKDKEEKQEYREKGNEIYFSRIFPTLDYAEMKGKIIAINIDSGDYTIADTTIDAGMKIHQKCPDARVWTVRVGYPYVRRLLGVDRDKLV